MTDTAHAQRVAAWEDNDGQHPDAYQFKMAFRDAVLAAMDTCSEENHMPKVIDADLPALFRALDELSNALWYRSF